MIDPIPDPTKVLANWAAMAIFGRASESGKDPSGWSVDGLMLSRRTFALLYADIPWLMTLMDNDQ